MQLNPEGFVTWFQTLIVERRTSIGEDFSPARALQPTKTAKAGAIISQTPLI
jgi:hypothetical protein